MRRFPLSLLLVAIGCNAEGAFDDDSRPAAVVQAGDVLATGGILATGEVRAGTVQAGPVEAGSVDAGTVFADYVSAGDVNAGAVLAGDVTATGNVLIQGGTPEVAVEDVDVVMGYCTGEPCNAASWTAAVQGACGGAGGTLVGFTVAGGGVGMLASPTELVVRWMFVAVVECPP